MKEYIEREAAINELTEENLVLNLDSVMDGLSNQIKRSAHRILASLPAANVVEVRHGKWIEENTRPRSSQFCCSVCHRTAYDPQPTRIKDWKKRCRYAYCPNCGADMRGGVNDV